MAKLSPYSDQSLSEVELNQLRDLLRRIVGDFSIPYLDDALHLMFAPQKYDTATSLIAHNLRELRSAILSVWTPYEYVKRVSEDEASTLLGILAKVNLLGTELGEAVRCALDQNDTYIEGQLGAVADSLGIDKNHPAVLHWSKSSLHSYAHRPGLEFPRLVDKEFVREINTQLRMIIDLLILIEGNFGVKIVQIDEATKLPNKANARYLTHHLPRAPILISYLFERKVPPLDIEWLPWLDRRKFFTDPSPMSKEEVDRVPWFQSKFLERAAESKTLEAIAILEKITSSTSYQVHQTILKVIIECPNFSLVKSLAEKEIEWFKNLSSFEYYDSSLYLDLLSVCIKAKEWSLACELSKSLLAFQAKSPKSHSYHDPKAKVGDYNFEEVMESVAASYVGEDERLLDVYGNSLDTALAARQWGVAIEKHTDYSYIWWPLEYERPGSMISEDLLIFQRIVRLCHELSDTKSITWNKLIAWLISKDSTTYFRIVLDLMLRSDFPESLVMNTLRKIDFLNDPGLFDGVAKLLRHKFETFWKNDREQILTALKRPTGDRFNDKDRYRFYATVRDHLDPEQKALLGKYEVESGSLDNVLFYQSPQVRSGFEAPVSEAELQAMDIESVIAKVDQYDMGTFDIDHKLEGLSRLIAVDASSNPDKYLTSKIFQLKSPRPLGEIFRGLEEAIKNDVRIEYSKLSDFLIECSNADIRNLPLYSFAHFARELVNKLSTPLTQMDRSTIAEILLRSYQYDFSENDDSKEANVGVLNTVRGGAIMGLVQIAKIEKANDEESALLHRLKDELSLIAETEPSLQIREAFGLELPNLMGLDAEWFNSLVPYVFPKDPENIQSWLATWSNFQFWGPSLDLISSLFSEYDYALDNLEALSTTGYHNDPALRTVEQIFLIYYYGRIELDNKTLQKAITMSSDEIKAGLANYLRPSQLDPNLENHTVIIQRLKDYYLDRSRRGDIGQHEAEALIVWFIGPAFERDWSVMQLEKLIPLANEFWDAEKLLLYLLLAVDSNSEQIITVLNPMLQKMDNFAILHVKEELRNLLLALQEVGKSQEVKVIVHRLVARALPYFEDMI